MLASHDNVVYFAHGKESGPWGEKITAMAEVAKAKGFHVESPDYSFTMDPDERVKKLLSLQPAAKKHLVLIGSSMGGYVSTVASTQLKPAGLFLLAPAFYRTGYIQPSPKPHAGHAAIVHGWDDEIIPVEHSIRFAKEYKIPLHIFADNHRLMNVLPEIVRLFDLFLDELLTKKP